MNYNGQVYFDQKLMNLPCSILAMNYNLENPAG